MRISCKLFVVLHWGRPEANPHQYSLSNRAGTGAVVHALTTATHTNPTNTTRRPHCKPSSNNSNPPNFYWPSWMTSMPWFSATESVQYTTSWPNTSTHTRAHTRIQFNSGKTRVWNAAGVALPHLDPLGPDVWVGDHALPSEQQGLTILGAPLGSLEYVAEQVEHTTRSDQCLLERIRALDDPQASWLLLLFCASPRCN